MENNDITFLLQKKKTRGAFRKIQKEWDKIRTKQNCL